MEEGKINIEMGDMVGKTYFKVATWFNQDFGSDRERQEALKHVCVEVIQQVLEDTVLQLQGVNGGGVETIQSEETTKSPNNNGGNPLFKVNEDAIIKGLNGQK